MAKKTLLERATFFSLLKIISYRKLIFPSFYCLKEITANFFLLQIRAVLNKKKYPVSNVEHPLDKKIPFLPQAVNVYMDFSPLWMRTQGFLLETFGKNAVPEVKEFLFSIARVYKNAARVYKKNMSTTRRPDYSKKINFIVIHLFDPHLLCVPSLHIMVLINTYTRFNKEIDALAALKNTTEDFSAVKQRIFKRAIMISDSVLYVKQHSVNCIAAALYAMSITEKDLFKEEDANTFVSALFNCRPAGMEAANNADINLYITKDDAAALRSYIINLYKDFLNAGKSQFTGEYDFYTPRRWEKPLLDFLLLCRS